MAGAAPSVDAYRATSTILTLGNQLFFGAVTIQVLVPLLSASDARGAGHPGKRTAILFSAALLGLTSPLLYAAIATPKSLLLVLIPRAGGGALAAGQLQIRAFGCALLPMLWAGVFSAFLQSRRIFWITAASQSFNNIAVAALLLITRRVDYALAAGNILGFGAMLAVHLIYFVRADDSGPSGWSEPWREAVRAVRLALPPLLALLPPLAGATIILRTLSAAPGGTLAECGFAGKPGILVSLLPGALFTVMLPDLASKRVLHPEAHLAAVQRILRFALLVTMPLTTILVVLRHPLIHLLFGGHALSAVALNRIAIYFAILAIAGPATAVSAAMGQVCASLLDTRAGLFATCLACGVTLAIVPWAGTHYGARGVMAAVSTTAWIVCFWYAAYAAVVHHLSGWLSLGAYGLRVGFATVCGAGLAAALQGLVLYKFEATAIGAAANLAIAGTSATLTVYVAASLLGIEEMRELRASLRWPSGRRLAAPSRV